MPACPNLYDTATPTVDIAVDGQRAAMASGSRALAAGDAAGAGTDQVYGAGRDDVVAVTAGMPDGITVWQSADSVWMTPAVGDITGDGVPDLLIGAPGSDEGVGQVIVLAGPVTRLRTWDDNPITVKGADTTAFGSAPQVGDATGDGALDLLVTDGNASGALVSLFAGPVDVDTDLGAAVATWSEDSPDGASSYGSAATGLLTDLDGDGIDDVVLFDAASSSVPVRSGCDSDSPGAIGVFDGPAAGGSYWLGDADALLFGAVNRAFFGFSVTGGDVDGDGYGDLLVSGYGANWHPELQLLVGPIRAGASPVAEFEVGVSGVVNSIGDLDGDGHADVIASAGDTAFDTGDPSGPEVDAWYGPFAGSYGVLPDGCTYAADARWVDSTGLSFGNAVLAADLTHSGRGTLAVGSSAADGTGVIDLWSGQ